MKATLKKKQLAILYFSPKKVFIKPQKQPFRGVLTKCAENMQQIYRRTLMPRCDFNFIKMTVRHGCSSANLLHIFRTSFPKNTSGGLLLRVLIGSISYNAQIKLMIRSKFFIVVTSLTPIYFLFLFQSQSSIAP